MAIILLIETEDGEVTELPILDTTVIGRSSSCDLKIADAKMSGSHCSFEINNKGQLLLKDLGSTNGSFINNSQVQQTLIQINDIVRVGNTHITIEEKKLTFSEKKAIGISTAKKNKETTLPQMTSTKQEQVVEKEIPKVSKEITANEISKESLKEATKKKLISLSKKLKDTKSIKVGWSKTEGEIDQEASSGLTKLLELATNKVKKKKK